MALLPAPKPMKVIVSEAGASVYSASETAAKEFPDLDVSLRGAVSIARRLQDPLAEVGKIEPKSIGVGQYQHDLSEHKLSRSLDAVVEDWDAHLDKMCAFWSSVVLMSGRYKGRPMPAHAAIPGLSDQHFRRWLALFAETAFAVCPPPAAQLLIDKAKRIADSLKTGIALYRQAGASDSASESRASPA